VAAVLLTVSLWTQSTEMYVSLPLQSRFFSIITPDLLGISVDFGWMMDLGCIGGQFWIGSHSMGMLE
jgi:hypothetical protein